MNKINIIILIMVINLAICDLVLLKSADQANQKEPILEGNNSIAQSLTAENSFSLNDLLGSREPIECVAESAAGSQKTTIKAYIANGNAKTESNDIIDGKISITNAIFSKDGYRYTWPSLKDPDKGYKININAVADQRSELAGDSQNFGLDTKWNFECKPYASNGLEFNPPTDMAFEDLTEQTIEMLDNENITTPATAEKTF